MSNTIFVSAVDPSADYYGAELVTALKAKDPSLRFIGIGGPQLEAAGVEIIKNLVESSSIGFIEPMAHLPRLLSGLYAAKKHLKALPPDLFLPIDGQGFNIPLLKTANEAGVPCAYFIPPQYWQWGKAESGQSIATLCKKILCIFPQAARFYQDCNTDASYLGHPLLDRYPLKEYPIPSSIPSQLNTLCIFPGSRLQEIKHSAPVLLGAAKKLQESLPEFRCLISCIYPKYEARLRALCQKLGLNAEIVDWPSQELIPKADFSLMSSGTISLEHALLSKPSVVAYRFSAASYWLIRRVVGKDFAKRVKYISLPNILLEKEMLPEFLQAKATPEALSNQVLSFLNSPAKHKQFLADAKALRDKLGNEGCFDRAADAIIDAL
mgnify:FL=1